jgi:hypothetical protein
MTQKHKAVPTTIVDRRKTRIKPRATSDYKSAQALSIIDVAILFASLNLVAAASTTSLAEGNACTVIEPSCKLQKQLSPV